MTTEYAQSVHTQARADVEATNMFSAKTTQCLQMLGYTLDDIAKLENDIKDRIYR